MILKNLKISTNSKEKNNGKIISNVSKKLNFLVTGDKPTARKITEAKSLGIKIISQPEFLKILNIKDY